MGHSLPTQVYCQIFSNNFLNVYTIHGFLGDASGKESTCQCRRCKKHRFDPWVGKIPRRKKWQPPPVFLLGEPHGQRCLAGCSPWGCKESNMTEQLSTAQHMHTIIYYLWCSCRSRWGSSLSISKIRNRGGERGSTNAKVVRMLGFEMWALKS